MNQSRHPGINSEQAAEYAARLAAQEQMLAGSFPFIIKDERIFCTDSLWRLIGLASADGSAPLESWLACVEPGDRRNLQLAVAHARETGEDLTLDVRLAQSGDAPRYFRLQARPEQDSPGSALAGFLVDVTNIRQACNDQIDRQAREIQALYEISRLLAQMVDLNTVLQQIADSAAVLIQRDCRTVLHLLEPDGETLLPAAVGGTSTPERLAPLNFRRGEGLVGIALETGATLAVPDAQNDARFRTDGSGDSRVGAIIVAPVKFGEQNLGTLSIYSSRKDVFTPDDKRLLTMLGANAAVAIEKTRLYANLETTLKQEQAARAQLVQSEKLAALGRIVASVAHELNNPLQAIQNALYLIRLEEDLSNQAIEDLQVALNEANRMAALIQRLRETYRPTSGEDYETASLNELVLEAHKLISAHLRHQDILFKFEGDERLPEVRLVPDQIKQVILNICLNAVEMMADHPAPQGGHFLHLETRHRPDIQTIELLITDNGPGIDQAVLPYIFDPFVTTKDNGTGLGLAITYDIVRRHNGRVEVKSEPGNQTTFLVELPAQ